MIGMSFQQQEKLYAMIETAVETKKPIVFPVDVYPVLQVCAGSTFTLQGLFWVDESRNVYEPFLKMEFRSKDDPCLPGLYVVGSKCLDGRSSGDVSIFRPENRYKSR